LYVIGAISSLGKTTFIQQLVEQMAELGEQVIFFSLEQSKFELTAKAISRQSFKINPKKANTTLEVMRGNLSEETLEAIQSYSLIAKNTIIQEGNFNTNVKTIREYLKNYIELNPNTSPVVVVDYLQILQPTDTKLSEKQQVDFNVSELKRISRDYKLPIFVIASFNRENYLNTVDFTSFKESGGIEYTADVVMGLQLKVVNDLASINNITDKRNKINEAKSKLPREIELIGLKNRNGKSYFKCNYTFYPSYNYFEEV
jgi:replicative DNA helicase